MNENDAQTNTQKINLNTRNIQYFHTSNVNFESP